MPREKRRLEDLPENLRQKITDIIDLYRSIMDKKEDGIQIHTHSYALLKCAKKFYLKPHTIQNYLSDYT